MFGIIGNLRLTFAIAAMTIGSLCVATLAVLGGLFFSLSASVQQDVEAEVTSSMRVAAQILQVNLPNLKVEIDEAGVVTALEARSMPRFRSHDVIDAVAAAAGEGVTIYVYDPETSPDMLVGSTSLMDAAGERLLDQPIPEGTPLFAGLTENQLVEQPEEINGESHLRRYQPIATADGTVIGALSVAVRRASFEAVVGQSM
ncbi:MAG: hypothetical protein GX970_03195, partial [Phyllobacteriaceae bacterium]|nr:hypothetical protein [Phyllobacteriaceae bacterium]